MGRSENPGFKVGNSFPSLFGLYNSTGKEINGVIEKSCPYQFYKTGELSAKDKEWFNGMKEYCKNDSVESCPERIQETVMKMKNAPKESFAVDYYTIYDPDITSNKYKQRAVVYFDDEFNIICAWKYEKDDWFLLEENITALNII